MYYKLLREFSNEFCYDLRKLSHKNVIRIIFDQENGYYDFIYPKTLIGIFELQELLDKYPNELEKVRNIKEFIKSYRILKYERYTGAYNVVERGKIEDCPYIY